MGVLDEEVLDEEEAEEVLDEEEAEEVLDEEEAEMTGLSETAKNQDAINRSALLQDSYEEEEEENEEGEEEEEEKHEVDGMSRKRKVVEEVRRSSRLRGQDCGLA